MEVTGTQSEQKPKDGKANVTGTPRAIRRA
jgi:hypothetical protein